MTRTILDFLTQAMNLVPLESQRRVAKLFDMAIAFGALERAAGNESLQDLDAVGARYDDWLREINESAALPELPAFASPSSPSSDPVSMMMTALPQLIAMMDASKPNRVERLVHSLLQSGSGPYQDSARLMVSYARQLDRELTLSETAPASDRIS
jgi:hypothetical protein